MIGPKIVQNREQAMTDKKIRNPARSISALKQAFYILNCMADRRTRKEIVEEFGGDDQLVSIWINYLEERNYLTIDGSLTNRGYEALKHFVFLNSKEIATS